MTRTLAAPRLESIIAGAMSFIFAMIDFSKIEIFLFDEENSAKSVLVVLLSRLAKLWLLIEIRGYRS